MEYLDSLQSTGSVWGFPRPVQSPQGLWRSDTPPGNIMFTSWHERKGSVAAMVELILRNIGLEGQGSIPLPTVSFMERFESMERRVPSETVASVVGEMQGAHRSDARLPFFEVIMAMGVDLLLREKKWISPSIGGRDGRKGGRDRRDPPESPSSQTSPFADHQAFLGPVFARFRGKKAGIIKKRGIDWSLL